MIFLLLFLHLLCGAAACYMFIRDMNQEYLDGSDFMLLFLLLMFGIGSFIAAFLATHPLPHIQWKNPFYEENK